MALHQPQHDQPLDGQRDDEREGRRGGHHEAADHHRLRADAFGKNPGRPLADGLRDQRRSDDDADESVRCAALTEVKRKYRQQRSDTRTGDEDAGDDSKKSRTALRLAHSGKPKL